MKVYRYESSSEEVTQPTNKPVIFLAGPTVRGNQTHLTSWRFDAIRKFEEQGFDGTLIVPEFVSKTESDQHRYDIPEWEYKGLVYSDVNMFWIPRTRELIGLTTNHELGYWMARDRNKVIYGRPNSAYRIAYLDIMWKLDAKDVSDVEKVDTNIFETLEDTVKASIKLAEKRQKYRLIN